MAREHAGGPGTITLLDTNADEARFIIGEKRINGELNPPPDIVVITPAMLATLREIPPEMMEADGADIQLKTFEVFGQLVAWIVRTQEQGAFAGTDVDIHGPFLFETTPSPEDLDVSPGSIRVLSRNELAVTIIYRDKETDNMRDPDAVTVTITRESVAGYPLVQKSEIEAVNSDPNNDGYWYTFDAPGGAVAFRKYRVHEDFAHGWITYFTGPYRVENKS